MREGELLYFTQAELEVMLELTGGCSVYRIGAPPDDSALTRAFASLFQRGYLIRQGKGFRPGQQGAFFQELCAAPLIVTLDARYPRELTAVCYVAGKAVWLAELLRTRLSEQVRLRRMERREMKGWLFDADVLEPPLLTRADTQELSVFPDTAAGQPRLRLERYANRGKRLGTYEILEGTVLPLVRIREREEEEMEFYTSEALDSVLARCFRKEHYDYRKHESPRIGKRVQFLSG